MSKLPALQRIVISIHALRKESDTVITFGTGTSIYFNPRSP